MKIEIVRPNKQYLANTPTSDFGGLIKKMKAGKEQRQSARAPKKAARKEKRAARKLSRSERQGFFQNLKAKTLEFWQKRKLKIQDRRLAKGKKPLLKKNRNQRPLIAVEPTSPNQPMVFQDILPTVTTMPNGALVKNNPDGTEVVLPSNTELVSLTTPNGEPIKIDKVDINNRPVEYDQEDNPFIAYGEEEVDEYIGPSGQPELVRPETSTETAGWKSLKGWQKGLIIGGIITGIGLIGYGIYRAQKGGK